MGSPKDLNDPAEYAEALVCANFEKDPEQLAGWLAGDPNINENPSRKWYLYFAERLIDLAPRPELGFRNRPQLAVPVPKIGRNELCPCGSGKKFKQCHLGREEAAAWKIGSPTPAIRAMAIARIVQESPLELLDRVPREKAVPLALTEMAAAYQRGGRLDEALTLLRMVMDGDREDPHILYDYWIARYAEWLVDADRAEEGEAFLMDEFEAPRNVQPSQVAQKLAAFYIDLGDPDSADTWVDTALEGEPKNPFNHYLKGMLLHMAKEWDVAIEAYKRALEFSSQFRDEEQVYMTRLVAEAVEFAQKREQVQEQGDDDDDSQEAVQ